MIEIKNTGDLDISLISDILRIDSLVFPKHLQGTFDEVYGRFKANRDSLVLLYDKTVLAGYVCLFPIDDELYEEILKRKKLFDSDIPCKHIKQYQPNCTYRLYAISTAICPEYQGKGLSKLLIKGFYKYLLDKKKNNILFSSVLSTAVTGGGDYLLKELGFSRKNELPGGYKLYELQIDDNYYDTIEKLLDPDFTTPA